MTDRQPLAWKTVLFVPANKPKFLDSAIKIKPDAVQLDLEDSISKENKEQARAFVKEACAQLSRNNIAAVVRINPDRENLLKDLDACVSEHLSALTIPKLETISQIDFIDREIEKRENKGLLEPGAIKLLGLIETLTGLQNRENWANASPRLSGLALGSEDLCQQIACEPTSTNLMEPCRKVLYAAREANLAAWGMPISIAEFNDIKGLGNAMQLAKEMGMTGVWCIHPKQVDVARNIFKPSDTEIAWAQEIVIAYEAALAAGNGAVAFNGAMVDLPVYQRALDLLRQID